MLSVILETTFTQDRSVSEIEDNFSQHFVASGGSASSSSPHSSLPFPSSDFNLLARLPPSSSPQLISPRHFRSHISPLDDEAPEERERQMPKHSDEHSAENSTHRQSEHSPRYKSKTFKDKRKHSTGKKAKQKEEDADEESRGDPDTKSVMRVNQHRSTAGAITFVNTRDFQS